MLYTTLLAERPLKVIKGRRKQDTALCKIYKIFVKLSDF